MRCAAVVRSCAAATLAVSFSAASADVVWDEAIDGDLSDDYLAPTFIDVSEGSNNVIFTTDQDGDDDDIFTFTIAAILEVNDDCEGSIPATVGLVGTSDFFL